MTDFSKYKNVSLALDTYSKVDKLRKVIVPNTTLSRAQTINILVNEKISWLPIAELAIYITTSSLIFFHIFNLNFCQCKSENCCTSKSDKKSNSINN